MNESQTSAAVSDTRIDLSIWLTKQQAADRIGVSTKAIERFTQAGKLEQRSRAQAHGPKVAVYFPDDVAKLAAERQRSPSAFVLPAGPDSASNGNGARGDVSLRLNTSPPLSALSPLSPEDPLRAFAAAVYAAVMSQTSQTSPLDAVSQTSFVTIREASLATGLTQAYLQRAIEAGTLKAIRDRGWRIRRRDLEQL